MSQTVRLLLIVGTITLAGTVVYGQSNNIPDRFPTYNQIKPASQEIMDYVPGPGNSLSNAVKQKVAFRLFDYPAGTVTYVLNGKSTTDEKYARNVVNQAGNSITNIAINGPTEAGKRTITIDFTTAK